MGQLDASEPSGGARRTLQRLRCGLLQMPNVEASRQYPFLGIEDNNKCMNKKRESKQTQDPFARKKVKSIARVNEILFIYASLKAKILV